MTETFAERIDRLNRLRTLRVGSRVRVIASGRTGKLVRNRGRDGWDVRWDEPQFGVEVSRVATANIDREETA